MNLSCIHCGNEFSITADQLGGRGRCPHCRAEITLPKAQNNGGEAKGLEPPSSLFENTVSGLTSCIVHMVILIVLGLITWGGERGFGGGEQVLIGELPSEQLNAQFDDQLDPEDALIKQDQTETLDGSLEEVLPPSAATVDPTASETLDVNISPSSGSQNAVDLETLRMAQAGSSSGEDFDGLIQRLKRDGLDIAIVFDSTGSMSGEIDQVKNQVERIGRTLVKLVPKTRISICTYRDRGDMYVVKGHPLDGKITNVKTYLSDIYASGGGDHPEAVHEGLRWAVSQNRFRPRARKVVLLFGDAPPHQEHKAACLKLASEFRRQQQGIVSTVTCRRQSRLPEFVEIAQMGGGEAFLTADEREIMTQLIVLVFGSKHRSKVLEAFELLEN